MKKTVLTVFASLFISAAFSQNVGIGQSVPVTKLHVLTTAASDGVRIQNNAANGDPLLQFNVNGTNRITMGIDDSDADKFKIGSTAITTNTTFTITTNRLVGLRTTAPTNMFHMTNGGVTVGAAPMAAFNNASVSGVSVSGYNQSATSGYNGVEGITAYSGTGFIAAGVFGLHIYQGTNNSIGIGVRGHTNEWQGTGVRGSRYNSGGANSGWGGQFYDDLGYTGFFGTISDARTKKDITPLSGALGILNQLRPVTYNYDLEKYPGMGLNPTMEYGFIAQEVAQVIPEIVREKNFDVTACTEVNSAEAIESGTQKFMSMDYSRLIPILTQAINEQQATIESLEDRIAKLEKLVQEMADNN